MQKTQPRGIQRSSASYVSFALIFTSCPSLAFTNWFSMEDTTPNGAYPHQSGMMIRLIFETRLYVSSGMLHKTWTILMGGCFAAGIDFLVPIFSGVMYTLGEV